MPEIKRVDLPGGQWWEIDLDPPYGKVKKLTAESDDIDMLLAVSHAWSFPEPLGREAIESQGVKAVFPVLREVMDEIVPFFSGLSLRTGKPTSIKRSGRAE